MSVRLIAGRAGSGKTRWCQSQICEELAASLTDGPRLIILVPEQAGLQMERSLLAASSSHIHHNTYGPSSQDARSLQGVRRRPEHFLTDGPRHSSISHTAM